MDKNDEYDSDSAPGSDDERPSEANGDLPLLPLGGEKVQATAVGNMSYKKMLPDVAVELEFGEGDESAFSSGSEADVFDPSLITPHAHPKKVVPEKKELAIDLDRVDSFDDSMIPEADQLLLSPIRPANTTLHRRRALGKTPLSRKPYAILEDDIPLTVLKSSQQLEKSSSLEDDDSDDEPRPHVSLDFGTSSLLIRNDSPRALIVMDQTQGFDIRRRELFLALDTLAESLPEYTEFTLKDVAVGGTAFTFAALASVYNVKFAGAFAGIIATGLKWTVEATDAFKHYCQVMGFAVNVPINWRSILGALDKFRDDWVDRWKKNRMSMPMDSFFKSLIAVMALIAVIGAIPNVVFSLEGVIENPVLAVFWGIGMTILQLVTIGALNLRGLTNMFDLDKEKNESVHHKLNKELRRIRQCLPKALGNLWSDDDLDRMSNGQLVRSPTGFFTIRNIVGYGLWLCVLPYSAAVGDSVYTRLMVKALGSVGGQTCNPSFKISGGIADVLTVVSVSVLTAVAGGLKFILLGKANYNFVQSIASARDESLFKIGDYEVDVSSVQSKVWRKIFLFLSIFVAAWVCFGSLGSPSEVSEKYFWCDQGGITLLYAFAIGAIASFGLGTNDFKNFLDLLGSEVKKRADKYLPSVFPFLSAYDPVKRFGDTLEHFLLKIAYKKSAMTKSAYARENAVPFNSRSRIDATQAQAMGLDFHQGGEIAHMERRGMDGTGYSDSNKYTDRNMAYIKIRHGAYPGLFNDWLDYRRKRASIPVAPDPIQVEVLQDLNETPSDNYLLELDQTIPATQPRGMLDSDDEANENISEDNNPTF